MGRHCGFDSVMSKILKWGLDLSAANVPLMGGRQSLHLDDVRIAGELKKRYSLGE
jgi:hypothetical protein